MAESSFKREGLGGSPTTAARYTEREETVLQVLALIFASVSIVSTTLTFYWFLAMRRSFRHHLLMILIQSDMFKALWFMIYAIAALAPGSIASASIFCQISGFFTTVGLELSDFAVLMIAIHSALYIFKPPTSIGEGGLYPYRYIAYILWIGLPLIMASLAFINPTGAYKSGGTSCYLPVRPFWYRLALSWVPRYLIFIIILGIDVSIYFYVRHKFGDFSKNTNSSTQISRIQGSIKRRQRQNRSGRGNRRYSLPPTPPLAYHGLIPETRQPSLVSWIEPDHSVSNERPQPRSKTSGNSSFWNWTRRSFSRQLPKSAIFSMAPPSALVTTDTVGTMGTSPIETTSTASTPIEVPTHVLGTLPSSQTSWTTFAAGFNSRSPSKVSVLSFLRLTERHHSFSSDGLAPLPQLELVDSEGHNLTDISFMETRRKIKQQMRVLFIYPLAYLAMWAVPFVAHTLQYNDYYAANPPFALSAVSTVFTMSQSTVDCWIFNIKEKPWRRSAKKETWVAHVLVRLKGLRSGWKRSNFRGGGGKSKGAMDEEARFAYQRRDEERTARASEIGSAGRSERRERSWWDEMDGMTGTISPLAESSATALVDGQEAEVADSSSQPLESMGRSAPTEGCAIT